MGRYAQTKDLKEGDFGRLAGAKPTTFGKMAEALLEAFAEKKRRGGRPNKLCLEDMLLMALEHLRECRAYFCRCRSCGLSEPNACKGIKWVGGALAKDKAFGLPGRKALLKGDAEHGTVLISSTISGFSKSRGQGSGRAQGARASTDSTKIHPCRAKRQGEGRLPGFNRSVSSGRVKRFRIVACRYRNHRRRFGLRFNLICAVCNHELPN